MTIIDFGATIYRFTNLYIRNHETSVLIVRGLRPLISVTLKVLFKVNFKRMTLFGNNIKQLRRYSNGLF